MSQYDAVRKQLALADKAFDKLREETIEPSYTIETLEHLQKAVTEIYKIVESLKES